MCWLVCVVCVRVCLLLFHLCVSPYVDPRLRVGSCSCVYATCVCFCVSIFVRVCVYVCLYCTIACACVCACVRACGKLGLTVSLRECVGVCVGSGCVCTVLLFS